MELKSHTLFPKMFWSTHINLDIKKLQDESYQIKNKFPTISKSNKGYKSYHSPDLKDIGDFPVLQYLMETIYKCVLTIHQNKREGMIELANFWININNKGSSHYPHLHSDSMYSGVYYIKVPINAKEAGDLIFHRDFSESFILGSRCGKYKDGYTQDASDYIRASVSPIEEVLILFPSWLPHSVSENNTNEDRISLSFNYRIKN
tara:strand:+ start:401 stop:1012 length:612 start_codon:yes stop_codon:yes gene_type:complete